MYPGRCSSPKKARLDCHDVLLAKTRAGGEGGGRLHGCLGRQGESIAQEAQGLVVRAVPLAEPTPGDCSCQRAFGGCVCRAEGAQDGEIL